MATILEFRVPSARQPAKTLRRRRKSAEIVIFPGVRYEHWQEAGSPQLGSANQVARDTLKLVE